MIRLQTQQLLQLFPQPGMALPQVDIQGISIDSRVDCQDSLFVAIKGENFDGHDYLDAALKKGACMALVEHYVDVDLPQVVVRDTRQALGELAHYWRQSLSVKVVALTGSNGKTTVKEMLGRILSAHAPTLITAGNLNNDIGVPLTLMRLSTRDRFAVIEMGANHRHEIQQLVQIADPDVVYVNNAGKAHVEGFGGVQGVVEAKGEMYRYCRPQTTAVFNLDESSCAYWKSSAVSQSVLDFSSQTRADVQGEIEFDKNGIKITFGHDGQQAGLQLGILGQHNGQNALAAVSLAIAAGLDLKACTQALAGFSAVQGRQQLLHGPAQSRIIDDSYNANPDSVKAAINSLILLPGKHWLALGDMAELGDSADEYHREVAQHAQQKGVQKMFAYGPLSCQAASVFGVHGHCFHSHRAMADSIQPLLQENVSLLIKGSRSSHMERLVKSLSITSNSAAEEVGYAV